MIEIYFLNNKKQWHRKNGPANIDSDGYIEYCLNDNRHRIDGPAIINASGIEEYWLNDIRYRKKEYYEKLKELNISINK